MRHKWINYIQEYNWAVNSIRPGGFNYVTTVSRRTAERSVNIGVRSVNTRLLRILIYFTVYFTLSTGKTRLSFWESSWLVSVIQRKLLFAASQSPIDVTPIPYVKQWRAILIFSLHNLACLTIHHLKRTFFYPVYLAGKILYTSEICMFINLLPTPIYDNISYVKFSVMRIPSNIIKNLRISVDNIFTFSSFPKRISL